VLQHVVGHAPILAFDFVRPSHVAAEVGWLPLKRLECILSYVSREALAKMPCKGCLLNNIIWKKASITWNTSKPERD